MKAKKCFGYLDNRGYNRCDKCGLFMSPHSPGSSSYFVPDSDRSYEDFGYRCAKCTKKYGEIPPSQGCVQRFCSTTFTVRYNSCILINNYKP